MRYVENRSARLEGSARQQAAKAECAVVDTHGVYTTLAHFLSGDNPWGLHQDMRFSLPMSRVLQGMRIADAARFAIETGASHIALLDEDYETLVDVLIDPQPSGKRIPPALARAVIGLFRALETADQGTDGARTEPARDLAEDP